MIADRDAIPKSQIVNVGDELKIVVKGTGSKGDWYGTYQGLVIFIQKIEKCTLGEQITVKITGVCSKCAFAKKV